jgi:hypothetical protein
LRAGDVCGWLVRARLAGVVLRVPRPATAFRPFADVRLFAARPAFAALRPARAGAALRTALRFAAADVPFFFLPAFAGPLFAERFFAAFAMSLPPDRRYAETGPGPAPGR